MKIREANLSDLEALTEIYNQAILEKTATADLIPFHTFERKDWLEGRINSHLPILVAESQSGVMGYAHLSEYRKGRSGLQETAEITYYVGKQHRQKGIAGRLITELENRAPSCKIRVLIAILLDVNDKSIRLLEKFNFQKWGAMPQVANMDGKICGQFIYGKLININEHASDHAFLLSGLT